MPILPLRNLGQFGIINDVDAYGLPPTAWSSGVNVRFKNGSVLRSPVYRSAFTSLANSSPRYVAANTPAGGTDNIILGSLNGRVASFKNGTETDLTLSGYTNSNSELAYSSAHLGNVFYINRGDRVPWFMRTSDTSMQSLATGGSGAWPSNYTATLIRASNSALIAFGITKAGVSLPQMVKTSEFAQSGAIPANWDPTITGTNATENILAEMEGPIVDAQNLGEIVIVYGAAETWTMQLTGDTNIWAYHRIFSDAGAINANCSVEVNRKHYVFGLTDIWVHDGVSMQSIADQRTRNFIFQAINVSKADRCFVRHNPVLKEIYFYFVSGDGLTGFLSTVNDGCNRAAVFDYVNNTWSYDDAPFVYFGGMGNLNTVQTYATTTTATYANIGGTYLDQDDSLKKVFVCVGDANATYGLSESLYALDLQGPGSSIAFPVDTHATLGWTLIRDGIDLEEVGADLKGYKVTNSIYPRARLEADAAPIVFDVGAADYFNDPVQWAPSQTYDGDALYKLDYNMAGRYLALKITHADWHYVNLSGFDLDVDVFGER